MKHKYILCLDLGLITMISHYLCENTPKSKKFHIQNLLDQSISDKEYLTCIKNLDLGRAQWFTPIIPALWEAKAGGS